MSVQSVGIFADFGIWSDVQAWVDWYVRLGVTDIVIGIDHSDDGQLQFHASPDAVRRAAELLWASDVVPHLLSWPTPNRRHIDDEVQRVGSLAQEIQARSWILDCEGRWELDPLAAGDGGLDHRGAAVYLSEQLEGFGPLAVVTGYGHLRPSVRPLVELVADACIPQAYSVYLENQAWTHAAGAEPGVLQDSSYKTWADISETAPLWMGLACYAQERPSLSGRPAIPQLVAMRRAWRATRLLGVDEVYYWSGAHLRAGSAWPGHEERYQFVQRKARNARRRTGRLREGIDDEWA